MDKLRVICHMMASVDGKILSANSFAIAVDAAGKLGWENAEMDGDYGGGHLNGSFLNAGLVDELSLLLVPVADGTPQSPSIFDVSSYLQKQGAASLQLTAVQQMAHGMVRLRYRF